MRTSVALAVLLALALHVGCSSDSSSQSSSNDPPVAQAPERVIATILLAKNQLTLVGLRPAGASALPQSGRSDPKVAWRYESEAGEILAQGSIPNPLLVTSEFQNGIPAPKSFTAAAALFEVELPNSGGIFVLSDVSGSGQTQSWDSIAEALKVFIQKLVGAFHFGSGSGGNGGASADAGGSSDGSTGGSAGSAGGGAIVDGVGPTEEVVKPSSGCKAYTLLFAAEGYTESERGKFEQDVAGVISSLSSTPGYADNWKYVSVWRKFFVSQESGISDPGAGLRRETAFRVEHAFDPNDPAMYRSIWMAEDTPKETMAKLSEAKAESGADAVLVLANTTEIGGAASPEQQLGFFTTDEELGPTAGHELAHALFGLEDEYDYGTCNPSAYDPLGPNVALGAPYPWASMMSKGVNIPTVDTDPNVVGAYKGALYCAEGVYRPQHTCFMRELASNFCKVCKAHVDKMFVSRAAACQPEGSCTHSECQSGVALDDECSPCASTVCATHPECCDPTAGSWSAECVTVAQGIVGACRGICADGKTSCGHSECAQGNALTSGCSTCAGSICQRDPFCCSEKWDELCTKEAREDPYCACPD